MGFLKGCAKLLGSAVLGATGVASSVLKEMCDTVGVDVGSEIFGAAKDASFNGIKGIWGIEDSGEAEYMSEEETEADAINKERRALRSRALRCKDMAAKAETEELRQKFMDRYEELMDQANSL